MKLSTFFSIYVESWMLISWSKSLKNEYKFTHILLLLKFKNILIKVAISFLLAPIDNKIRYLNVK